MKPGYSGADLKKQKCGSRKSRKSTQAYSTYIYKLKKTSTAVTDTASVPGWLRAELCTRLGPEAARLAKLNRRGMITQREMQFMLLFSRQGKLRLQKWYVPLSDKEKKKITRELVQTVLARKPKMCSFLEWRDLKIVYKRYASLYFCCAIEDQDNELITLEIIHRYVELLDKYFGSVCELDIIFNFEKAYFILDEFLLGGEAQETSKKNVLKAIEQADLLQEVK
ncbi:AP-1 complex subunit sigma-2 isoform X3, partial [Clarias magur]